MGKSRTLFVLAGIILTLSPLVGRPAFAQQAAAAFPVETVPNVRNDPLSFAFSADGTLALSGGGSGSVDIWGVRSGRLIRRLSGHKQQVLAVAYVLDGRQVLSASRDNSVRLWDAATGRLLRTVQLSGQTEYLSVLAISPDGSHVLSGTLYGGMKLWDATTGRLLKTFATGSGYTAGANAVAFSTDGARAAASAVTGQIKVWDIATGKLIRTLNGHQNLAVVQALAFSSDGTKLVSGGLDKTMRLWDLTTGQSLRTFVHPDGVSSVAFSVDGARIASGCSDHNLRVWDTASGRLLYAQPHTWGPILSFSPDATHLLSGSDSYPLQIKFWDVESGSLTRDFGGDREYLVETKFSPDGSHIISGGASIQQWDAGTGQLLSTLPQLETRAFSSASRDGSYAVWRMADEKTLKFVDTATGKVISTFTGHTEPVRQYVISPDATRVASGGFYEKTIKLWDAATGSLVRTFPQESVEELAFSPDGKRILAGSFSNVAKLWDVATGQLVRTFPHTASVKSVAFSPDAARILTGDTDTGKNVQLWEVASGRLLRTFSGHTGEVYYGVSFSPDGTRALSAAYDKTVKLWDLAAGQLLRSIDVDARSPVFSPDGKRALLDNAIWDLETGERLVSIIKSASNEWLAITREGFFAASEHGADILSVVRGLDVWSVDQFYQSLYRPDLVREKLAGDPRGFVREAATQLDLNKVIASGSAPDVRLTLPGRALGAGAVDSNSVSAEAEIADRGGGIGRVEWRVNGVTTGIDTPAAAAAGQPLRLTRSLLLDPGDNAIEVVAYNGANLISSVPARLNVAAQVASPSIQPPQPAAPNAAPSPAPAAAAKPRLFALVAGVNAYADKRIQLSYAVPDAKDVARGFNEAGGSLYRSVAVKLMADAEVTRDKLDAAFAEIAGQVQPSDVFVLYLAGHGKTVDGRYYFIPQDFTIDGEFNDKSVNTAVKAKAIAQDQLQRWFASVPARKSVILFDTCDSGTLTGDAGETQQLEKGAANDRLAQATGRSIITASGGSQEALEGYRGHGLFTYEVLDALDRADGDRSGTIEVTELAAYVYAQVSELSQKVFKQRQAPQMKITTNYPLTRQMHVLQDETPALVSEAKPAYQVAQTAQLQIQPGPGATVVRNLSAKTAVTVLESKNGWSLVASDGKPLGYVATRDLAPVQ